MKKEDSAERFQGRFRRGGPGLTWQWIKNDHRHVLLGDARIPPEDAEYYEVFSAEPSLFGKFLATAPTREGVQSFAQKYGTLYSAGRVPRRKGSGHGETLGIWKAEIEAMKRLWQIAEALRLDRGRLGDLIEWRDDGPYLREPKGSIRKPRAIGLSTHRRNWMEDPGASHTAWRRATAARSLEEAARSLLIEEVSRRIGRPAVHLARYRRGESEGFTVGIEPRNLREALWLQFAFALERGAEFLECEYCGAWFPRKRQQRKGLPVGKKFCTASHKASFYRREREA